MIVHDEVRDLDTVGFCLGGHLAVRAARRAPGIALALFPRTR